MKCAACAAKVEKAVGELAGVDSCSVNLLTKTLSVDGNVNKDKVLSVISDCGFEGKERAGKKNSQYTVEGMKCAACAAKVEKAVGELAGVDSCSVNLLTKTLSVDGDRKSTRLNSSH